MFLYNHFVNGHGIRDIFFEMKRGVSGKGARCMPRSTRTGFVLFMLLLVAFGHWCPSGEWLHNIGFYYLCRKGVCIQYNHRPRSSLYRRYCNCDLCSHQWQFKYRQYHHGIMFNHATFGDNNIPLTSGTYDSSSNVGPLQTRTYVFNVMTNELDGTYYPTFSLNLRDADSLYYRTPVKVDNTPLMMSVISKPDTFTQGKKESVTVQIANPRQNDVKNVIIEATGNGTTVTPSSQYLGALSANSATNVTFSVTPDTESVLTMTVKYDNGDNHHSVTQSLPVTFGTDKKQATPKISNVEVTLTSGVYHVTGDVTNAGLTTANGVTVTALSPAIPEDPYRSYVIGALKPDDFGSFEVTFTAANNTVSVPIQVSYKDSDGNVISVQQDVGISGAKADTANQQGNPLLFLGIIIIVILAAGGWYFYNKRIKKQ